MAGEDAVDALTDAVTHALDALGTVKVALALHDRRLNTQQAEIESLRRDLGRVQRALDGRAVLAREPEGPNMMDVLAKLKDAATNPQTQDDEVTALHAPITEEQSKVIKKRQSWGRRRAK